MALYSHYEPFIEKSDDDLVKIAQLQLFYTLFASLIIRAGFAEEDDHNVFFFDALLVFIQYIGPGFTVYFLYKEHADDKEAKGDAKRAEEAKKKKHWDETEGVEITIDREAMHGHLAQEPNAQLSQPVTATATAPSTALTLSSSHPHHVYLGQEAQTLPPPPPDKRPGFTAVLSKLFTRKKEIEEPVTSSTTETTTENTTENTTGVLALGRPKRNSVLL
jgi:hypothetical protein